jgi:hypothetical protein
MNGRGNRRRFVAAMLSFLQPGIGHVYLREWLRAALWGIVWAGSLLVVLTTAGVEPSARNLLATTTGFFSVVEGFPIEAALAMFTVTVLATIDAYWLAARENRRIGEATRCPNCGKELDPTLEFCHWCTARLDERPDGQNRRADGPGR